jgi:hypothetical protein
MAHHRTPEIDRALEVVVSEINSLTERQDGGPGVVLTAGGLVIAGTIIPDWQWFDEVEHVARRRSRCTPAAPSTTSTVAGRGCYEASASRWYGTGRSTVLRRMR